MTQEAGLHKAPLFLLYLNVLIVATCGLIYELLAGTLASYLVGDSVTQFSLVIGIYLSAMGVGAWLSQFIHDRLAKCFIEVELAVALVGGSSVPLLFFAFTLVSWFQLLLLSWVFLIGLLVGLELPLLMRILKEYVEFEDLVSSVLTFDYIGALIASIMFPILFVPHLGLIRTSLIFGLLNAIVGLWGTFLLAPIIKKQHLNGLRGRAVLIIGLLICALIKADTLTTLAEEKQLGHSIIHAESSPYQRILVTKNTKGFQLFLNGHLQFNSTDEYRYHEALVHPALLASPQAKRILVLGGGDGLAVREILKYPDIREIWLVDLDPQMTKLARTLPYLQELNQQSLTDKRVHVVNADAFLWVNTPHDLFDVVIIDFPDPSNFSVGKLYTSIFYQRLKSQLSPQATISIQCTSPLVAPQSYWCIMNTLEQAGFHVYPYHASVPTFGIWGYALAAQQPLDIHALTVPQQLSGKLKFLNQQTFQHLFDQPQDLVRVEAEINRLDNQALVQYYEREWGAWE